MRLELHSTLSASLAQHKIRYSRDLGRIPDARKSNKTATQPLRLDAGLRAGQVFNVGETTQIMS